MTFLKKICDENDIEFIDNYDSFLLASGEMPSSFYHHDKLHLNVHGTKRLLLSMNKVITVTKNSPRQSSSQRSYSAVTTRFILEQRPFSSTQKRSK